MRKSNGHIRNSTYRMERIMAGAYNSWNVVCKTWYGLTGVYPTPKDFKGKVDQLSRFDLPEIVDNFDFGHARVVIEAMYRKAAYEKKPIRHITGFFDPIVYADESVLEAFKLCLRNKVQVRVIITDPVKYQLNDIEFIQCLNAAKDEGFLTLQDYQGDEDIAHMFAVGDDGAVFRYETDPQKHTAKVSFNMPSIGHGFVVDFDELSERISKQ